MTQGYIHLHPNDNVVVALTELEAGQKIAAVRLPGNIQPGHKIAIRDITKGAGVIKYNQSIGRATCDISAGDHVHCHNLQADIQEKEYQFATLREEVSPEPAGKSFMGYKRKSGKAGTRNYVGILTSVNCSATVACRVADYFKSNLHEHYPNVDGIVALTHGSGCAMDAEGEGMRVLKRTLRGYLHHGNFAGVLVIGLGCETNQMDGLLNPEDQNSDHITTVNIQQAGGTTAAINESIAKAEQLLAEANRCQRRKLPVAALTLGLQCGGSDGFSGITANPALGVAADLLVRHGGTAILSETPEIVGAEHLLTKRAISAEVGRKLLRRISWWQEYVARHGGEMDNNPSYGNRQGGLTTILEKSLGALAKAGTTPLMDVYEFAEEITTPGLVFMDSPGFDPVSVTGQVAAGANVVCFTTGRGSAFGCKPCPSLKLASNNRIYQHMHEDMDINCGVVADNPESVEQCGQEIFTAIIEVASGMQTRSEILGYGDNEFSPWLLGAVM